MRIKNLVGTVLLSFALISSTGCSMESSNEPDAPPSSGTRSLDDATSDTQAVSSEILDMFRIKGKASEVGPGVSMCDEERDRNKFFLTRHHWGFTPDRPEQLADVMKRLKEELPARGWKVVEYGLDSSPNKNLSLTADNSKKGFGVHIVHRTKDNPPKLAVTVVSGCYQVPKGQRVDRY